MNEKSPGLYIHVPFCRSKCLYCDFYSIASLSLVPEWLRAIRQEALLYKDLFTGFDSIYFGGGTPSILGDRNIAELLEWLFKNINVRPRSEITIEANPDDLPSLNLKILADSGVNRISLGVQSLEDRELQFLGRKHGSTEALRALEKIRAGAIKNLSADLMYGLDTQTPDSWRKTLKGVLQFRPEHLSCYQLTFEQGAAFGKMRANGKVRAISPEMETAFFILTSRFLERQGYLHYEISNFALNRDLRSRHNLKYWDHSPYLGLGPSAHSFLDGKRWWNVRSVKKYCEMPAELKKPVESSEELTQEQLQLETIGLGLRTGCDGVPLRSVMPLPEKGSEKTAALQESALQIAATLATLQKNGLIKLENGRIIPTRRGFLVADSLAVVF